MGAGPVAARPPLCPGRLAEQEAKARENLHGPRWWMVGIPPVMAALRA
jgi:hypothetical protein